MQLPNVALAGRYPGESKIQAERRRAWCGSHFCDPIVSRWLRHNPPPTSWVGTQLEYAYEEMPDPDKFLGRLLLSVTLPR
jgi:hypothetical protein